MNLKLQPIIRLFLESYLFMIVPKAEIAPNFFKSNALFSIMDYKTFLYVFGGYKTFFSIFSFFVYGRFSSLGDTEQYINGWYGINTESFLKPTQMMETFGGFFGLITRYTWFANVPFLFLSLYGTWYAMKRLRLTRIQSFIFLFLLLLPTFNIWTGIVSKESVGNFFMGVIAGYFIDAYREKRLTPKVVEIIAFYLAAVFKPQYLIALGHVWVILALTKGLNGKLILIAGATLIGLDVYLLYLNREIIGEFSLVMEIFFDPLSASTRPNNIWVEKFDVFKNAPYGMFIAFVGPTFSEALAKPLQMLVYIESLIILTIFISILALIFRNNVATGRISPTRFYMLFFSFIWLLTVHYPFGALNPGSAVRYRENFYLYLSVILIFCWSESHREKSFSPVQRFGESDYLKSA